MSDLMTCGLIAGLMLGGVILIAVVAKLREVRAAAVWPSARGKVITSQVQARRKRDNDSEEVANYPLVEYEYGVNGKTYTGSRIGIGEDVANTDVSKTLEKYPVGASVLVFYDPKDPGKALLERDMPPGMGKGIVILLCFFFGGPILLALAFSSLPAKIAPYLPKPQRAPMVLVLFAMGLFAAFIGRAIGKQARAARRWPVAEGLVLSSDVETYRSRTKHGRTMTMYRANVVYAYEVEGHRYGGSRVGLGGVVGASSPKWAEREVAKYQPKSPVRVHFNPENHSESVLEPKASAVWVVWVVVAVLWGIAYLVATR